MAKGAVAGGLKVPGPVGVGAGALIGGLGAIGKASKAAASVSRGKGAAAGAAGGAAIGGMAGSMIGGASKSTKPSNPLAGKAKGLGINTMDPKQNGLLPLPKKNGGATGSIQNMPYKSTDPKPQIVPLGTAKMKKNTGGSMAVI
jgi:hypothetical protein